MPQPRFVNTESMESPNRAEENFKTFFSNLSKEYGEKQAKNILDPIWEEYGKGAQDKEAHRKASVSLEKSELSPTKRLEAQTRLNEIEKINIERDKALNAKVHKGLLTQEEKIRQKGNLEKAGWPDYAADVYLDSPPGVKQTMEREHAELTKRGFRKPLVQVPPGVDTLPIAGQELIPEQKKATTSIPEEEWALPVVPANITPAEKVKWENSNEKENNKELRATTEKKKSFRSNDNLITSMTQINDGKYLPEGISKMLIIDPSTGDIRPTAQLAKVQNPQTELYVKNLKQWLRGAKDFFGARVTNFDVTSFMAQLPSLLNSEQGRRLILKQMKYVNDLESIHNNTLNEGLKKYGRTANYSQISQEVDKKVSAKEEDLMGKINNLVLASRDIETMTQNPEKFKGMILMQTNKGDFRAVPKERTEYLKKEKKWRDF